jgi:hypothetical protein
MTAGGCSGVTGRWSDILIPVGLGLAVKLALGLVVGLLIVAGILYARLRQQENSDWISSRAPDRATLHAIFARENQPGFAHNHMISLTERKPGWLRYFTQRLIFFAIATIGPRLYKPGYLGEIGTIHFARWITVPGTRDLVFLSNYGGSWEAYLEDFITLAHNGLTGVWSNTVGFPKTTNLVNDGATDGERFKRYARQSMLPTLFWYSAYPDLDTDMIRANAEIRRGLSSAMTEDAAQLWLSHFGSTKRPDSKFVTNEIQSLVFGGLGFLPAATATFWRVPAEQGGARAWLAGVSEYIAWSDGRRFQDNAAVPAIVQLGLSAPGLAALGLPDEGLASFPPAFLDGMAARARILGDSEASDPAYWWWSEPADAALIIYGESALAVDTLHKRLAALATMHGARLVHEVPLRDLPPQQPVLVSAEDTASGNARHAIQRHDPEPFGFADGISQPLIAGTYKAERPQAHPLHIVAPGEFVLGYPDNRGNRPPGPTLASIHDPTNILPVFDDDASGPVGDVNRPRDLGRNGTFLVIRQLEQDVDAFHAYCKEQSAKLQATIAFRHRIWSPLNSSAPSWSAAGRTARRWCAQRIASRRHPQSLPRTPSCRGSRTPKACAARSARTSGGRTRGIASTPAPPIRLRSAIVTACSGSAASTSRRQTRSPEFSSCASIAISNGNSSSSSRPGSTAMSSRSHARPIWPASAIPSSLVANPIAGSPSRPAMAR